MEKDKKKINFNDLGKLSKVGNCYKYMEEIANKLEVKEYINQAEKIKIIENIIRVVDLKHKAEKKQVDDSINTVYKGNSCEVDIKNAYDAISSNITMEKKLLYAILIDKYVMEAILS